jgi:hypothetical protein
MSANDIINAFLGELQSANGPIICLTILAFLSPWLARLFLSGLPSEYVRRQWYAPISFTYAAAVVANHFAFTTAESYFVAISVYYGVFITIWPIGAPVPGRFSESCDSPRATSAATVAPPALSSGG